MAFDGPAERVEFIVDFARERTISRFDPSWTNLDSVLQSTIGTLAQPVNERQILDFPRQI